MRFGPRKLMVRLMEPADNARNGAGGGAASGSEPYDEVGALANFLTAEERGNREQRRRAPAADDAPNDERHTPASYEAGDHGDELEDGAAGPDDDDPDAGDADPDDPDAIDDGEAEIDPTLLKRKIRVKVDGADQVVTIDELRNGYQRHQDYTRKTQEIAGLRQQYVQGHGVILQQHEALDQGLQHMQALIAQQVPPRPSAQEWNELFNTNPVEAMRLRTVFEDADRRTAELGRVRAANAAQARDIAVGQRMERINLEAQKLLAARPELRTPERAQAFHRQITEYATSTYGFTPQELGNVLDHRHLDILDKARRYDEAVARSKERPRQRRAEGDEAPARTPRSAAPGPAGGQQRSRPNQAVQAQQRLAKSGRVDDAAAALMGILD